MVDRVDLGHHSQGRIPSARKLAEAASGVAGGLRAVTLPALTNCQHCRRRGSAGSGRKPSAWTRSAPRQTAGRSYIAEYLHLSEGGRPCRIDDGTRRRALPRQARKDCFVVLLVRQHCVEF
jgi:hypothetical protein